VRKGWFAGASRAITIALALAAGGVDIAPGQERSGATRDAPRWNDRIADVELWRIPKMPERGRVIREDDAGGRPLRCAAGVRLDDPGDPQVTDVEFGIEMAPEFLSDDEPELRDPRERAKMYVRVRLADARTGAPVAVARPIWHLNSPPSDGAWTFSPMDGQGFVRAEAGLADADGLTLGQAGGRVASQTALVSMELPAGGTIRIVDIVGAGFSIAEYWALARCVCDIDEPDIRYLGCRTVGWR
jgi:hypothetical protein